MKNISIFAFLFLSNLALSQSFTILNRSSQPCKIRVWQSGSLIHNHIMNDGDNLKIDDIKDGILVQWWFEFDSDDHYDELDIRLNGGWVQRLITEETIRTSRGMGVWRAFRFEKRSIPKNRVCDSLEPRA